MKLRAHLGAGCGRLKVGGRVITGDLYKGAWKDGDDRSAKEMIGLLRNDKSGKE